MNACCRSMLWSALLLLAAAGNALAQGPNLWDMPEIQAKYLRTRVIAELLLRQGKFAEAEQVSAQGAQLVPHDPISYVNLARAQARQGKSSEALTNLAKAIERGFNSPQALEQLPEFVSLRAEPRFVEAIAEAQTATPKLNPWQRALSAAPVRDGKAIVSEANTAFDWKHSSFISMFAPAVDARPPEKAVYGGGFGDKVSAWVKEGSAAGLAGVYYENRDGAHSQFNTGRFPQIALIEYSDDLKKRNFHQGLQAKFLFNGIVLGNSSTALVNNPYWRSQTRLAYASPREMAALYLQYRQNHVYFYPEHEDHDPAKGDVYPTNTPYVITSQGSSGSDQPFMEATALTLASFQPEVRELLVKNGILMPTLQMLLRWNYHGIGREEAYLSGDAHPTVFDAGRLNAAGMAEMAHSIDKEEIPPLAQIKVVEEDQAVPGRDYFDVGARQVYFDTPCAIARIHRQTKYAYRIVVSAEDSRDVNDRPLTYHWSVLRGNEANIKMRSLNEQGSVVEFEIGWHPTLPIAPGSPMKSNRVDIGCFVNNGKYYSAPAFITIFTLANEARVYDDKQQIQSVDYKDHTTGGAYVDPMLDTPKAWRDDYHYDTNDRLTGFTRTRTNGTQEFTADGALVLERDDAGRPKTAQTVSYQSYQFDMKQPPILIQKKGDATLVYEYASADDRVGRAVRRVGADGRVVELPPRIGNAVSPRSQEIKPPAPRDDTPIDSGVDIENDLNFE